MKTIEQIIKDLKKINNKEDIYNEIICAFGDYEIEGESEVIVSSPDQMNGFSPKDGMHSAYINHEDAPIIRIEIEEVAEGEYSITDAWEV